MFVDDVTKGVLLYSVCHYVPSDCVSTVYVCLLVGQCLKPSPFFVNPPPREDPKRGDLSAAPRWPSG